MNRTKKLALRRLEELAKDIQAGWKGVEKLPKQSPNWQKGVTWLSNFERLHDACEYLVKCVTPEQAKVALDILDGTQETDDDGNVIPVKAPEEPEAGICTQLGIIPESEIKRQEAETLSRKAKAEKEINRARVRSWWKFW